MSRRLYTRPSPGHASPIGPGQLQELRALLLGGEHGSERPELLADTALSPQRHRALAAALEVDVLDRTQLVRELFARTRSCLRARKSWLGYAHLMSPIASAASLVRIGDIPAR